MTGSISALSAPTKLKKQSPARTLQRSRLTSFRLLFLTDPAFPTKATRGISTERIRPSFPKELLCKMGLQEIFFARMKLLVSFHSLLRREGPLGIDLAVSKTTISTLEAPNHLHYLWQRTTCQRSCLVGISAKE